MPSYLAVPITAKRTFCQKCLGSAVDSPADGAILEIKCEFKVDNSILCSKCSSKNSLCDMVRSAYVSRANSWLIVVEVPMGMAGDLDLFCKVLQFADDVHQGLAPVPGLHAAPPYPPYPWGRRAKKAARKGSWSVGRAFRSAVVAHNAQFGLGGAKGVGKVCGKSTIQWRIAC